VGHQVAEEVLWDARIEVVEVLVGWKKQLAGEQGG